MKVLPFSLSCPFSYWLFLVALFFFSLFLVLHTFSIIILPALPTFFLGYFLLHLYIHPFFFFSFSLLLPLSLIVLSPLAVTALSPLFQLPLFISSPFSSSFPLLFSFLFLDQCRFQPICFLKNPKQESRKKQFCSAYFLNFFCFFFLFLMVN